jgi:integrase
MVYHSTLGHYPVKVRNREGTCETYAQIVRSHIIPAIGKFQLTKLTPEHVQAMLNRLSGTGLAPRTIRNVRAVLRDALNQAVKRRRIPYNVATLVEIPRAEKPAITPLTPEQARALLQAVHGDRLEALYRVALSLGLRRGEVLALRWEDIDFDQQELKVTGSIRRVGGLDALLGDVTGGDEGEEKNDDDEPGEDENKDRSTPQ